MRYSFILLAIFLSFSVSAQGITIKGAVGLNQEDALECYHLIIRSPENDSAYIAGDVFCTTNFEIQTNFSLPLHVEISRLGYQHAHIRIDHMENNIIDIGEINLELSAENIAEITVTAKNPL